MYKAQSINKNNSKLNKSSPFHKKADGNAFIQPRLVIGEPGNKFETEADKVADHVVEGTHNQDTFLSTSSVSPFFSSAQSLPVQNSLEEKFPEQEEVLEKSMEESVSLASHPGTEEEKEEYPVQEKTMDGEEEELVQAEQERQEVVNPSFEKDLINNRGSGNKMDDNTLAQMDRAFGTDFSQVNIHTGAHAVQMNRQLGAHAFTHGNDIYFNEGRYEPNSDSGKHLLAHELTHTLQQVPASPEVQKEDGQESNLDRLNEMLDRWNVPEDDVISICRALDEREKNTVRTNSSYKTRMADALNVGEMIRAVNNLGFPLETKLEWVKSAATFGTTFIDYSEIKAMVISAPQSERDVLKRSTTAGRSFFSGVCNNETMVKALNDLQFDLVTKLTWLKAEMTITSWELGYSTIQPWIVHANTMQTERDSLKTNTEVGLDFFVEVCTNATMVTALNDLQYDLVTKLTWLKAEMTITSLELGYSTIQPWIVHANTTQTERDSLKTNTGVGLDFFVAVCTNETMVTALNDLQFDLVTKLTWLKAEMTITSWELDYTTIQPWIVHANTTQIERDSLKTNTQVGMDFFVEVCTNATMVTALDDLQFDLITKLTWLNAELIITSWELNYITIKPWIIHANTTQIERDALKTDAWKEFFINVCTNVTIIEAVNDLQFDLKTKIEWVRTEAGLEEVKQVIELATQADRDVVWNDAAYLSSLRSEVGDDYYLWVIVKLRMLFVGTVSHTSALDADAAIQNHLATYVGGGVAAGRQIEGFVAIVDTTNWNIAGEHHYGATVWATKNINGFVDSADRVWIEQNSGNPGTMVHEAIHKYSSDQLIGVSQPLNEGVTEYFTRLVCNADGINITRRTNYQSNWTTTTKLVTLVGEAVVAAAYFDGDMETLENTFVAAKSASDWTNFINETKDKNWAAADGYL